MRQSLKSIRGKIVTAFGILGIAGLIWYGMENADLDLSIRLFGEKGHMIQMVIDWLAKTIHDWFPYMAFFGGILIMLFVVGSWIAEQVWKAQDAKSKKSDKPLA